MTLHLPEIPERFALAVRRLEGHLKRRVWLCVQGGPDEGPCCRLDEDFVAAIRAGIRKLPAGEKVAVLVQSRGGYAKPAYQAAVSLRRRGGFIAVIPSYAKSAATLLALGADEMILGENAELGPLDVQVWDADREGIRSALDEVQALQRLHAFALEAFDSTMILLALRSGKAYEKLMPIAFQYSTEMMRPLLEKIDTVHFSQASRQLKEAEEYAVRLLRPRCGAQCERIASDLVEKYPEHGFPIDSDELTRLGIPPSIPDEKLEEILQELEVAMPQMTAVGFLRETPR